MKRLWHRHLVRLIAKKSGVPSDVVDTVLNDMRRVILEELKKENVISIHLMGKFYAYRQSVRMYYSPAKKKRYQGKSSLIPRFTPSFRFRQALKGEYEEGPNTRGHEGRKFKRFPRKGDKIADIEIK